MRVYKKCGQYHVNHYDTDGEELDTVSFDGLTDTAEHVYKEWIANKTSFTVDFKDHRDRKGFGSRLTVLIAQDTGALRAKVK